MWILRSFLIILLALGSGKLCNILILLFTGDREEQNNLRYPSCNSNLRWFFYIPILGIVFTKHTYSECKKNNLIFLLINEILTPALIILLYLKFDFTFIFFQYMLLTILGVVIFYTDLFKRIIPDILIYPMIIAALLFSWVNSIGFWGALKGFILGASFFVIIALLFRWLTKRQGLGGGDIKLISVIGLSLGFKLTFLTIFLSSVLGVIIYAFSRVRKDILIPFGSFIVIAMYASMIIGNEMIDWYLGLWGVA